MKLWDKGKSLEEPVEEFTVGDDYILDQKLLYYDCMASIAHAKTIEKVGILTGDEADRLVTALRELSQTGLIIKREFEDVHTAIEHHLTELLGDLGRKIHAGRSRNDQVMAAFQLWVKDEIIEIFKNVISLCEVLNDFSRNNISGMPGYTHMQCAMPSSLQMLMGSYIESFLDDLIMLEAAWRINNKNPLGSAAGYGSSLNLPRDFTADLLGFEGSRNCIYVQARAKLVSSLIFPLCSIMKTIDRISTDLLTFTMSEFGFFSLPDEYCTGSSIMPQKKNYDVLEILRAKAQVVHSLLYRVDMTGCKLMSGYNRDYQLTKGPLMEAYSLTVKSLNILEIVFKKLKPDFARMKEAIHPYMFAADRAFELVRNEGLPFRDAYNKVAEELSELNVPENYFKNREFLGFQDYSPQIEDKKKVITDFVNKLNFD